VEMLRPVVGKSGGQHLALTRIVVSRTADPAESFGGVCGLEVPPVLVCLSFVEEFLRRDVISCEALDVLHVQADTRSAHVHRVRLQEILAPVPRDRVGRRGTIGRDQHVKVGADSLILVDRSREASKVVEQKENSVAPGLKRVQSVLKARERLDLQEKLEMCTCDAVGIFGNDLDANCPEQVGPKEHDVAAHVERLGVRMQRDGGRIVRGKGMHESMLQTGLMRHLIFQPCRCPRRVVDGRATEGVVQDQRPAGSAFVVLPQPGREFV